MTDLDNNVATIGLSACRDRVATLRFTSITVYQILAPFCSHSQTRSKNDRDQIGEECYEDPVLKEPRRTATFTLLFFEYLKNLSIRRLCPKILKVSLAVVNRKVVLHDAANTTFHLHEGRKGRETAAFSQEILHDLRPLHETLMTGVHSWWYGRQISGDGTLTGCAGKSVGVPAW